MTGQRVEWAPRRRLYVEHCTYQSLGIGSCPFPASHTVTVDVNGYQVSHQVCVQHAHDIAGRERAAGHGATITTGAGL